jgi:hypothetical protein
MQNIFIKKYFLFTVGSFCRVKRFTTESRDSFKDFQNSRMMPDQMRKWLKQQSKGGTNVSMVTEDMSRNKCFFPGSSITCFIYFLYPFVTCLLTLPHITKQN